MDMSNLPVEILDGIAKNVFIDRDITFVQWKDTLPLLSVCRMWRRTLKPIIYGRAIIECAEDYEIIDEEEIPPVEEEDGDSFKWHSNIEFLRRVGNPGGVHTLTVYHDASSGIYKLLQYFEKQVVANFALFCNTRALNMYFLFGEEPDPDDVDTEVCRGEPLKVDRMVGAFAKIFTQVQRLEIVDTDNLYNPTLLSKLCNAIVRACSQSLVVCLVDPPLDLGRLRFSHRLWTLSTELKECSTDVQPQVDVANMKHMKLSNMPGEFPWQWFENSYTPGVVSFDNLESLTVGCSTPLTKRDHVVESQALLDPPTYPEFRFPKLNTLELNQCHNTYLPLFCGWKPEFLVCFMITGSAEHICHFPLRNIQAAGNVLACFYSVPQVMERRFYEATNHMYGRIDKTHSACLVLHNTAFRLNLNAIQWPNLTHLILHARLPLPDILNLVDWLPGLISLSLRSMEYGVASRDRFSRSCPRWHQDVAKPLNTNIQNLMLSDTCFTDLPVRFAADTALYLIARIVTLNLLLIYEELMVPLRNAIEQEQLPHPHIRKIIEKLGGDM